MADNGDAVPAVIVDDCFDGVDGSLMKFLR